MQIAFARQPIVRADRTIFAYELLFRRPGSESAVFTDGAAATANVLVHAFADLQVQEVCGRAPAFVNLPEILLADRTYETLSPTSVILELLEAPADDRLFEQSVQAAKQRGFRIALDDFDWQPHFLPLLAVADFIKLDVNALGLERVRESVQRLSQLSARLIAKKVETHEEFAALKSMGIRLFQGFFLMQPELVQTRRVLPSQARLLQLVSRLSDPTLGVREIGDLVSLDLALSVRLLRIVNSAFYGLQRKVNTPRDAVVLLGINQTRRWATLMALADLGAGRPDLVHTAAIRGRMCEELAITAGAAHPEEWYTAGLLSLAGVVLDLPIEQAVADLELGPTVRAALLYGEGVVGSAVSCVAAHEQGRFGEQVPPGLTSEQVGEAYDRAARWVATMVAQLESA